MVSSIASPGAVQRDELDALFDIDPGMNELFEQLRENTNTDGNNTRKPIREHSVSARRDEGLGLDEEVKITKKRQPVAKLDATRLLSDPGIPKLQRISKNRLKFRGKGHEFSDIALLLRTYQLWLDELYPRAKFADGLAIIEKLGHTKRLQIMRKAWIDEGRPKASLEADDAEFEESLPLTTDPGSEAEQVSKDSPSGPGNPEIDKPRTDVLRPSAGSSLDEIHGEPDEDELDALLAEDLFQNESEKRNSLEVTPESRLRDSTAVPEHLTDDDDEDLLREMGVW